jgi:hypothetical protein
MHFIANFYWLKYFTYNSVPVLTPNYKQYIFSPAKVRKGCYSLADLYVKSCIWIYFFGKGGVNFMKRLNGGASYKSLWISGLDNDLYSSG